VADTRVALLAMGCPTLSTTGDCDGRSLARAVNAAAGIDPDNPNGRAPLVTLAPGGSIGDAPPVQTAPGCASRAIAVGSVFDIAPQADELTWFSGHGPTLDVVAPGSLITTAWNDGGSRTVSGNCAAAAHAAGLAALLLQDAAQMQEPRDPKLSPEDVRERLWRTSAPLGERPFDDTYGHGRVDAAAALLSRELIRCRADDQCGEPGDCTSAAARRAGASPTRAATT